jgi:hypothetical protein
VTLGPGSHTLEATLGQTSGFDIDQLAFDSAPGGGAMPLASPTTLAAPPVSPSPAVRVDRQTATTIQLSVDGLSAAAGQAPVNLILGESINAGWKASVVGGGDLGPPVLIDGYANGWRLDPSSLGSALHDGTVSVVLSWQPQKEVDVALIVSLAAIIACLVLAFVPLRRRRRRSGRHRRGVDRSATGVDAEVGEVVAADAADAAHRPRLAVPFGSEGPRAALWVSLVSGVVGGAVAAAIASAPVGLAVGTAIAVVLLVPRLRIILGLAAIAGIVAAGVYVAVHQSQDHVLPNGNWPLSFGTASKLAWAGVVFLGADGIVEVVLRQRRRKRPEAVDDRNGP